MLACKGEGETFYCILNLVTSGKQFSFSWLFLLQINIIIYTTENIQLTFDNQFASIYVILFENILCLTIILILRLVYSIIVSNSFIGFKDFSVPAIEVVFVC